MMKPVASTIDFCAGALRAAALVLLPLATAVAQPSAAVPREIVFGGDSSFSPYEFRDAQGNPAGFNVDLIRAVARSRGLRVRVRLEPWRIIRAGVQDGSIDVATMYRSPRRAQEVDFAIPHELIYQEMFVRRGGPALRSLADLAGRRLLAETDTIATEALTELGYASSLRLVSSEPEALRALLRGEGDVAVVSQSVARPFLDRAEFAGRVEVTGPPVLLTEYAFVTRKGRRDLIETLNEGVAEAKASGEYERIYDRWLRPDRSAGLLREIVWAAAALLAAALIVFAWNQILRRRVERQRREISALARYQAEIDRANKELEAFSYSVSHDLRAPLRAIDGYARILLEDYAPRLDDEGRRVCGVICASVSGMGQLIDDLLAFARLSRAAMTPSSVDMRALAGAEFRGLAAPRVRFELGPLPSAVGDERLLRQVWINLLSNAVKFSARREQPAVWVTGEERDGECVYTVRDNGAGFDMRYAAKLFGVFQRLHGTQEFEGTGVGLAIVQRIVERHGGRVWAESVVDEGATFHFALPQNGPAGAAR
jgi:signal transduction histidine kinase